MVGPFAMSRECGTTVAPTGAKNQALVALLALSPGMSRPRRWLEDKLWSTFGPEQASANLRQALSKIRKSLGPLEDVLSADRTTVSLDPDRTQVDLLEGLIPTDKRTELLEGMDARDPEFEEWLRMERAELQTRFAQATPSDAKGILINCQVMTETPGQTRMIGDILTNQIGESIAEQIRAWRQSNADTEDEALLPSDVSIQCEIADMNDGVTFFLKCIHQPTSRILYSRVHTVSDLSQVLGWEESVSRIVFEAADTIIGKLPQVLDNNRPESRATALSRLALYRMFSFERDALREAYGLMNQAYKMDENGIYLAWSSLIRLIQQLELSEDDPAALREEAIDLHYRAMELASDNPLVHAIVSKVRGTALRDTIGVLDLARNALDRNPASAFAWKALAEAKMLGGDHDAALDASTRACQIARTSPFRHWWDTGHCVIAIACNRPQEAIRAAESAARAAPMSRPAHRHLLALYALEGEYDKAQAIADRMAKIEPGFTLDRIVNDDSYPVRTLRANGLLEPIRALL
ncbi:MAG: transcriptional regulator [Paracoccaceae bacterium]|nr:transcriptional regulator [Paracoccaceae bacterium]